MATFSLTSIAASISGVLAALNIPLPGGINPLCREGTTPWRKAPSPLDYDVYEPIPRIIAGAESSQDLAIFIFGGGFHSGTNKNDFFVGTAFMGRVIASHNSMPCRIALINYPTCTLPIETMIIFYAVLLGVAILLAVLLSFIVLPLRFWLFLAGIGYAVVGWLVWVREFKTSGRQDGVCTLCTTNIVNADHQLEHIVTAIKDLVARYQPQHLIISGHSAGGHMAAMVGLEAPRHFPDVPRVSVVGISGVYNVSKLWHHAQESWPGLIVTEWCLKPAFFSARIGERPDQVRARLSPITVLDQQSDHTIRAEARRQARHFHLISARHDNEMLMAQGDEFQVALIERGIDATRHYNVGVGHGLSLIRSAKLVDLLAAIASRKPLPVD